MVYNSFQTSILTRIGLLVVNLMAFSYLVIRQERFFTLLFLALTALIQIILLFVYLNRTNRNLARFLLLLTHEDVSVVHWKDRVEKTFRGLHHSFKKVNEEINRIRMEKEKGSILLEGIIQHVETGIIVADEEGRVEVVNDAALLALGVNRLGNLSELNRLHGDLAANMAAMKYESGNVLAYQRGGQEASHMLIRVSLLRLEDRKFRIFSLQDIGSQLEAKEIESWQKMTRVLSHEISNSVTPISTLGDGILMKLKQLKKEREGSLTIDKEAARDLLQSAELIRQRSDGLVEFMDHYKKFSKLPDPVPGKISVHHFLEGLELLFREDFRKTGIHLEITVPDSSLAIHGDQKLLEQAFINLLRNSMEALSDSVDGRIRLSVEKISNHRICFEIEDNGRGIPKDVLPQVFTPFFTTRRGGTGIGMTLVRKIIIMSGGSVQIDSEPGAGTIVTIRLPRF
jgi:nitrogen fixation/metabolism regulation signal transduction histidine kinase